MIKELSVSGMQCTGCETIIEEAIAMLDGIKSVKADYASSIVKIHFDEDKVNQLKNSEYYRRKWL